MKPKTTPAPAAVFLHVSELRPNPRNPRLHGEEVVRLARTILRTAWGAPIVAQARSRRIIGGHGRLEAALRILAGLEVDGEPRGGAEHRFDRDAPGPGMVPVRLVDVSDAEADAMTVADNARALQGADDSVRVLELLSPFGRGTELLADIGFNDASLDALVQGAGDAILAAAEGDAASPGDDSTDGADASRDPAARPTTLVERFGIPPFTVLDARQGYWQERKRAWIARGIESELGRGNEGDRTRDGLTFSNSAQSPQMYAAKNEVEARLGRTLAWDEFLRDHAELTAQTGTSIFDPVLAEAAYRWFSAPGASVLDPFAGGSVRGLVAGWLGRAYTGVELRAEQVAANEAQAAAAALAGAPRWIVGDSRRLPGLLPAGEAFDLVFSCPPYADLERYSDDPADLSTMEWPAFCAAYREVIAHAVARLRPDRFACFVVGDLRDAKGRYRNFPGETIEAFRAAGCALYNEAVLVTQAASLAIRAPRAFLAARKLGKAHQNVLVFVKGDPKRATEACGQIDADELLGAVVEPPTDPAAAFGEVLA